MQRIRLGRTEAQVPSVALGTWGFSGPQKAGKMSVGWGGLDLGAASDALLTAYEAGLTHWDTADAYGAGQAERLIGALWDSIERDRIFLASKVGWDPGPYGHFYHPEQIRRQMDRTLKNLRTDYVDLYYLHHCDFGPDDIFLDDAITEVRRFQADGKIRFVGLSDWDSAKVLKYADKVDPDVVQPYRNVVDDSYASSGLQAWVEENDRGVAFFSPLRHGLLLGNYTTPVEFEAGDHRSRIAEFRDPEALLQLRRCGERVRERFPDHPQAVLHALVGVLLAGTSSASVLLGLRQPAHVVAAATVGEALDSADAEWVRQLYRAG